jgi:hypothetical protein
MGRNGRGDDTESVRGVWRMKESYVIAIDRPGMGDIPELVRCLSIEYAVEIVRALLACRDTNIVQVRVRIERIVNKEVAV